MSIQRRIQDQLEDIERRYNELLDDLQDRLPDRAAEWMERARELNADIRRQLTDAGKRLIGQDEDDAADADEASESSGETGDAGAPAPPAAPPAKKSAEPKLADMSRAELYERAKELDIEGRSRMSKAQLVAAIRRTG
ncbi:MAG: Rho termination factor N-terminal domain-containing protein [Acidimicrobiales bacterium]|nr:Rho termination factor N-terminal domain-containing protein [Acidimicrobiales bacterium]